MKTIISFIFMILSISFIRAQKNNESYKSFSQSNRKEHIIKFQNDSIILVKNVMTHMSGIVQVYGKYKILNNTIHIEIPNLDNNKIKELEKFGLSYLSNIKLKLSYSGKELVDNENGVVYVKSSVFNSKYFRRKSLSFLDGKKYVIDRGLINGYGIIEREPKNNKKFLKELEVVSNNPNNYIITKYYALEAYKKYGILGVNGVMDIKKNNR